MPPLSAGIVEVSATHAGTRLPPGLCTHTDGHTPRGDDSSCECLSTSVSSTSAAHQSQAQSRASIGESTTATSNRAAIFATAGCLLDHSQDRFSRQMQAGLQHNLQPAVHQPLQMPAPSLAALSAEKAVSTSTPSPPVLCRGQDGSAASALPSGERFVAEPSSAEVSQDDEASHVHQSSAAAFLDDILAQSNSGRLFKGRAHMHRLAGATSSSSQPADELLDRHVGVAKVTGHYTMCALMLWYT